MANGIALEAGGGQSSRSPVGGPVTIKVRGEDTGGAMTAFESSPDPGEGPPLHRHTREDELIYVLDGRFRVRLAEAETEAAAGAFVFVPKGLPHTWRNTGDERGRILFAFTPAAPGMERFFERAAELDEDASVAEAFARFAADAGMEVLGPPLGRIERPAR